MVVPPSHAQDVFVHSRIDMTIIRITGQDDEGTNLISGSTVAFFPEVRPEVRHYQVPIPSDAVVDHVTAAASDEFDVQN